MVFTRDPSSIPGTIESPPKGRRRPEAGPQAVALTQRPNDIRPRWRRGASKGGMEVSQNDAPKRDMTHRAPSSPVRSTGHGFHQGTSLHAHRDQVGPRVTPIQGRASATVADAHQGRRRTEVEARNSGIGPGQ
ncbi:hypothetical protein C2845_PM03G20250 [Panicum miliaceum]|uniref:Uncharacterized protein n=1 Tax=Panicum miliaceum TaxID=4540 RepID=A0A3L6T8V0_PANMI|nr:hypothetical protein C2845_PM03G20250 [Panicum miliaceum]